MTTEPQLYSFTWFNPLDSLDAENINALRPAIEIRAVVRGEPGEHAKIRYMLERGLQDMILLMSRAEGETHDE